MCVTVIEVRLTLYIVYVLLMKLLLSALFTGDSVQMALNTRREVDAMRSQADDYESSEVSKVDSL